MAVTELIGRLRRASQRPPRYLLKRVREIVARRLHRPWSNLYPHLLRPRAVAFAAGARSIDALWERLQRAPFFLDPSKRGEWTRHYRDWYPDGTRAIVAAADRARRHEFDLLGSGTVRFGPSLPWHTDFKTGREWPIEYSPGIHYSVLDRPTDVKLPWELSR